MSVSTEANLQEVVNILVGSLKRVGLSTSPRGWTLGQQHHGVNILLPWASAPQSICTGFPSCTNTQSICSPAWANALQAISPDIPHTPSPSLLPAHTKAMGNNTSHKQISNKSKTEAVTCPTCLVQRNGVDTMTQATQTVKFMTDAETETNSVVFKTTGIQVQPTLEESSTQVVMMTTTTEMQTDEKSLTNVSVQAATSMVDSELQTDTKETPHVQTQTDPEPTMEEVSTQTIMTTPTLEKPKSAESKIPIDKKKTYKPPNYPPRDNYHRPVFTPATPKQNFSKPVKRLTPVKSSPARPTMSSAIKTRTRSLSVATDTRGKPTLATKPPMSVSKRKSFPAANLTSTLNTLAKTKTNSPRRSSIGGSPTSRRTSFGVTVNRRSSLGAPAAMLKKAAQNRMKEKTKPASVVSTPKKLPPTGKATQQSVKKQLHTPRTAPRKTWKASIFSDTRRELMKDSRRQSDVIGLHPRLVDAYSPSMDKEQKRAQKTRKRILHDIDHNAYCHQTSREVQLVRPLPREGVEDTNDSLELTDSDDTFEDDWILKSFTTPILRKAVPKVTLVTEHKAHKNYTAHFPDYEVLVNHFNCGLDQHSLLNKLPSIITLNLPGVNLDIIGPIKFAFKFDERIHDYSSNQEQKIKDILDTLPGKILPDCDHVEANQLVLITAIEGTMYRVDPQIQVNEITPLYRADNPFKAVIMVFYKDLSRVEHRCIEC